jgi:twitching motility protein PilT
MAKIDQLFELMHREGASDLHLSAGAPPHLRVDGEMVAVEMEALTNEACQMLVFEILNEKQKRTFIENWELDFGYSVPNLCRVRCNVFMQRNGLGASFRAIPDRVKTVEELNLPQELLDLIRVRKGLICVTGPTGSGKSTTLAALVDHINRTENAHIITIEDPIEFVHTNQKSLVNQREVGGHTKSFANALKAALREDPDIIMVGEMRDVETIQLAITAAETGHLVFGTLHTSSAAKTVDRMIDVFPENKQPLIRTLLSEGLRGVIAQILLPKAEGHGRVPAFEVLVNSKAIANLIREGKSFQIGSAMQIGRGQGNITMDASIEGLLAKQLITAEEAGIALGKMNDKNGAPRTPPPPQSSPVPETTQAGGLMSKFRKTS